MYASAAKEAKMNKERTTQVRSRRALSVRLSS